MQDNVVEVLTSHGFKIVMDEPEMLIANGPKFRIRVLWGELKMQFGMEQTFDRWANSVDLEAPLKEDVEHFKNVLDEVAQLHKCHYCTSWNTPHKIANKDVCACCFKERTS